MLRRFITRKNIIRKQDHKKTIVCGLSFFFIFNQIKKPSQMAKSFYYVEL